MVFVRPDILQVGFWDRFELGYMIHKSPLMRIREPFGSNRFMDFGVQVDAAQLVVAQNQATVH